MLIVINIAILSFFTVPHIKRRILERFADTPKASILPLTVFKTKPLVIWTSDFHFAPTRDVRNYLEPMGVRFLDTSLDAYPMRCRPRRSCNEWRSLKVITPKNGLTLDRRLIPRFYEAYKDDADMKTVDAFACFHVSALCELFEPFNKSLIILATVRYELGRQNYRSWTTWNRNLIKYASQPWNVVAANNMYDVKYIKYFTGIQALLIPSWCNYTNQTYNPSRPGFLIAYRHNQYFIDRFLKTFRNNCKKSNCSVNLMTTRQKYPYYKYSDIAAHQGLVYVPYQVSVMSFFEQYRMNIPLFAPSKELLAEWDIKYGLMSSRRMNTFLGIKTKRSAVDPHPSQRSIPDPNSFSKESVHYWVQFCDYYNYPHVTYYSSIDDLQHILQSITSKRLQRISEQMKTFNIKENIRLRKTWRHILLKIANHSSNHPS